MRNKIAVFKGKKIRRQWDADKERLNSASSQPEKRDILTDMFEHFGIEVIDVNDQNLKPNKRKYGQK